MSQINFDLIANIDFNAEIPTDFFGRTEAEEVAARIRDFRWNDFDPDDDDGFIEADFDFLLSQILVDIDTELNGGGELQTRVEDFVERVRDGDFNATEIIPEDILNFIGATSTAVSDRLSDFLNGFEVYLESSANLFPADGDIDFNAQLKVVLPGLIDILNPFAFLGRIDDAIAAGIPAQGVSIEVFLDLLIHVSAVRRILVDRAVLAIDEYVDRIRDGEEEQPIGVFQRLFILHSRVEFQDALERFRFLMVQDQKCIIRANSFIWSGIDQFLTDLISVIFNGEENVWDLRANVQVLAECKRSYAEHHRKLAIFLASQNRSQEVEPDTSREYERPANRDELKDRAENALEEINLRIRESLEVHLEDGEIDETVVNIQLVEEVAAESDPVRLFVALHGDIIIGSHQNATREERLNDLKLRIMNHIIFYMNEEVANVQAQVVVEAQKRQTDDSFEVAVASEPSGTDFTESDTDSGDTDTDTDADSDSGDTATGTQTVSVSSGAVLVLSFLALALMLIF